MDCSNDVDQPDACTVPSVLELQQRFGADTKVIDFSRQDDDTLGVSYIIGDMPDLAEAFPELEEFYCMRCNGLTAGSVWSWVSTFTKLQVLDLTDSSRQGDMATIDLAACKDTLTVLKLAANQFDEAIVPAWMSTFAFTKLDLMSTFRIGDMDAIDLSSSYVSKRIHPSASTLPLHKIC